MTANASPSMMICGHCMSMPIRAAVLQTIASAA
ncbi:hypothetical protein F383_33238 [Gossypium arboreum]|uniref:Uncharacterized protein n=1 Tax=Gossypium arboreum TaxID=29729 RepID=A0A0B0MWZ1_GOSAR|nr:hypothetical protein F383_33238 [Gossypium arboreum]